MSEIMLQSSHLFTCTMAIVMASDTPLNVVDKFCYISILSSDANIGKDISTHTQPKLVNSADSPDACGTTTVFS